jgi:predicted enzyme related to lactoylglutathione lyase
MEYQVSERRKHVVSLCLWVDDFDRAIHFYCAQTGLFSIVVNSQSIHNVRLVYKSASAPFELNLFLATTPETSALVGRQGGPYPLFVLPVDSCRDTVDRLKQAGVQIKSFYELPYGTQATMIDPFGNQICISEMY